MHFRWLEQRLGRNSALDMVMLGRSLSAEDAVARGVAGHLFEDALAVAVPVEDYLSRLRAVDPSVRHAIKAVAGGRADPGLQFKACATAAAAKQDR